MIIPELGVAPLEHSGSDLEDELPTPDGLPSTDASQLVLGPTSPGVDLELVRALLELGVIPAMVMPIVEPGGGDIRDASWTTAGLRRPPTSIQKQAILLPLSGWQICIIGFKTQGSHY